MKSIFRYENSTAEMLNMSCYEIFWKAMHCQRPLTIFFLAINKVVVVFKTFETIGNMAINSFLFSIFTLRFNRFHSIHEVQNSDNNTYIYIKE